MKVIVTGAAGFIGSHVSQALIGRGDEVIGLDNLNDYYDVSLKQARLNRLTPHDAFTFHKIDLADADQTIELIVDQKPDVICHLAAQAGVRYSLEHPFKYAQSNVIGHLAVLEAARALKDTLRHCVYASSSSVYGEREGRFSESDEVNHPVSLYAATKRADELMSDSYAHLYKLPLTGLRFFTVYGEWGRPDMAYWIFAKAMMENRPIQLFNEGQNRRDFTYIEDVVTAVLRILDDTPGPRNDVFNIGGSNPVGTLALVKALETSLGLKADCKLVPPQPGDVSYTCADTTRLEAAYGAVPETSLEEGISRFASWFKDYLPAQN